MSDRDTRAPRDDVRARDEAPIESPIEDYARQDTADAPADVEMPRVSDDKDPWRGGVVDTPLQKEYENVATRDELARNLEDLIADARDWARDSEEDDAQAIVSALVDVYERLGGPVESTDDETQMDMGGARRIEAQD